MENNFLVRDLIKKITNENSDNIEVINVLEEKIKKTNFNRLVKNIVKNSRLNTLPMCLETPNELEGYGEEIKHLRSFE